ncbi:MAG: hypothetical protein WCZ66_00995 [Sphingomonadaceae bacterium]
MPLKKPKAVRVPLPFPDNELSKDENKRRRAIRAKRDLEELDGFSWSKKPRRGIAERVGDRMRRLPAQFPFLMAGVGMGGLLILGFVIASDTGLRVGPRVVYAESWGSERTAEDAAAEREAAMEALRQRYAAHNAEIDARAAAQREAALAREREAARGASPS